jgi:hypothetical protein
MSVREQTALMHEAMRIGGRPVLAKAAGEDSTPRLLDELLEAQDGTRKG